MMAVTNGFRDSWRGGKFFRFHRARFEKDRLFCRLEHLIFELPGSVCRSRKGRAAWVGGVGGVSGKRH